MSFIKPEKVSKLLYYCFFSDVFQILNDQNTIIGCVFKCHEDYKEYRMKIDDYDSSKLQFLTRENISKDTLFNSRFGEHSHFISNIIVNEKLNWLLTADWNGDLVKYSLSKNHCRKVIKYFGNLNIGEIRSSCTLGNLTVFGGHNRKIILIDNYNNKIVSAPIKVAIELIYSLQFCFNHSRNDKVFLAISGGDKDYSESKSDVLDMTPIIKKMRISYKEISSIEDQQHENHNNLKSSKNIINKV